MLEPVVAIVVAWAWLAESLDQVQLSGAALTLVGIGLAPVGPLKKPLPAASIYPNWGRRP